VQSGELCKDDIDRFIANIDKNNMGCWLWTGPKTTAGRGGLSVKGKYQYANQISWVVAGKGIPIGRIEVTCQTSRCIHPDHLKDSGAKDVDTSGKVKGRKQAKGKRDKPEKPYPDFPLHEHA